MSADRNNGRRSMIACGAGLTARLRDVRDRLIACKSLERKLYGPALPGVDRITMTAVLDWLLTVSEPDLKAYERRLTRECDRRYPPGPTNLDGGPAAG